jgi:hypothetical protein
MATYIKQHAEDAAHVTGDLGVEVLGVRNDALAARSDTNGDYTPIATDSAGVVKVANFQQTDLMMSGVTQVTPKFSAIAAATSGDNTLVTNPNAGKKIRVLALMLVAGAAGNIYFTSDAGGTVIFGGSTNKINLAANGGFVLPFNPVGWFETAADANVVMNASSTGPFSGGLVYIEV